jgi:hypothetical protein
MSVFVLCVEYMQSVEGVLILPAGSRSNTLVWLDIKNARGVALSNRESNYI